MPKQPVRANPERTAQIHVTAPGWLKNQILEAAEAADMSVNAWLTQAVMNQLSFGDSPRPEAKQMPTPHEVIADYLAGRQCLAPCGRPFPCEGADGPVEVSGLVFCRVCGVRVR